jgi:hypothetical protein
VGQRRVRLGRVRILELSATTGNYSGSLIASLSFTDFIMWVEAVHSNLFSSTYRR